MSVKRYSVKGSWCTDTEIAWGECEMVEAAAYDAALRELAECRRDAERYRWLLEQPDGFEITIREPSEDPDFEEGEWVSGHTPAEIDAAIRAAMAGETA